MAASLAFTSLTGCAAAPPEKIVPYVRPPEELLPGKPIVFATSMASTGYGLGLLVESHEGRPTKIEGNPEHPASLGATDVFAQASLLSLYDPDRSQTVSQNGAIDTWDAFITTLGDSMSRFQENGGNGLRILTGTVISPTLADLLAQTDTDNPIVRIDKEHFCRNPSRIPVERPAADRRDTGVSGRYPSFNLPLAGA